MGIFRRTTDILTANLHDLVDRFEQPERMLRQALRDMEATLTATRAAVARSIATEKLLTKVQAEHLAQVEHWRRRAADALAAGNDAIARKAVARQVDHQRSADKVEMQVAEAHVANETLRRQLGLLRDRHSAARTKLAILAAQQAAAQAQQEALTTLAAPRDASDAFGRFERFQRQIELAQAESLARLELETGGQETGGQWELESQLEHEATERTIDLELARLKAQRQPAADEGASS